MVYIRPDSLEGLRQYKYAGVDKSLTSRYILKPFYNNVVIKCFPMWMAPNLITLSGFGFVIFNFLTLLWFNPTLDKDCPTWVYLSWGVGLFLYQTFDAVDGAQARRTRQSGPLGELFDHGVDACNTTLELLIFAGATNLGQTWTTVIALFGSVLTFYVQTWEEYHTHVLTLGVVSGPVEGILTLCFVYFFTAIKGGGSYWHSSMLVTFGVPHFPWISDTVYNMPFTHWWLVYGSIMLLFSTASSISNVMRVRRERGQSAYKPLLGLLPAFGAWGLFVVYLAFHPEIRQNYLVPFILFIGLVNAYSVGQMIVAHLVKTSFPYHNVLILPLAFAVADSFGASLGLWSSIIGADLNQVEFVLLLLGFAIGIYGTFVYDVITTICDYLDIWCLTIKYPYNEEEDILKSKRP